MDRPKGSGASASGASIFRHSDDGCGSSSETDPEDDDADDALKILDKNKSAASGARPSNPKSSGN
eukprot:6725498-Pyramimonas_sp.AAC.1